MPWWRCARCSSTRAAKSPESPWRCPTCSCSRASPCSCSTSTTSADRFACSPPIELVGTDTRRLLDEQFPDLLDVVKEDNAGTVVASEVGGARLDRPTPFGGIRQSPLTVSCTSFRRSARSCRRDHGCYASRATLAASIAMRRSPRWGRRWSEPSTRTSPTASGCSSTWPSERCPIHRSSIRPRRCRHSIVCTTVYVNSL